MSSKLSKIIRRETDSTVFERGQARNLIISIEPAGRGEAIIGCRLKGTRQTYRIGVGSVHLLAVERHLQSIEKLAKRLHKNEGIPMRSARARATKEMAKELK